MEDIRPERPSFHSKDINVMWVNNINIFDMLNEIELFAKIGK
jgi:hypothetical protein